MANLNEIEIEYQETTVLPKFNELSELSIELLLYHKIPGRHILNSPITIVDKQKSDIYCECPNFKEKELVKSGWTYFIKYFPDINIENTDFAVR